MKHLFIINPAAGRSTDPAALSEKISSLCLSKGLEHEIYITRAPMDAAERVRSCGGEEIRVYACGGDGTLNEAVCGAAGKKNISVTHYPTGTGNDFIRCFGKGDSALFSDLDRLVDGSALPLDLIRCNDRYGINICSVGIDARVARDVHRIGSRLHIAGKLAYDLSLVGNLLHGINSRLTVRVGGRELSGSFALVCVCSGRFYGGGYNPMPDAEPDDGVLDMLIIKGVSVFRLAGLIGRYASGRYKEMGDWAEYYAGSSIELESESPMCVNIDGEIIETSRASFDVLPGGVNFVFPKGSAFYASRLEKIQVK